MKTPSNILLESSETEPDDCNRDPLEDGLPNIVEVGSNAYSISTLIIIISPIGLSPVGAGAKGSTRWTQSKDLTNSTRSGRPRATTEKQDRRITSLAKEQPCVTAQDITNQLDRRRVIVSERTVCRRLNEAGARYSRPMSKPLRTEHHRQNRLRWVQHHKATDWNQGEIEQFMHWQSSSERYRDDKNKAVQTAV
ncbi:unnamed protein product [Rotaria magnacalcarata]|uniref:Transposase Tc1-like domain-containing protein n=1 Tax=Rotaria magnacalcarata TaxID=392030 RepID=A0A818YGL8_9BILA